jgi:hypothetical protein
MALGDPASPPPEPDTIPPPPSDHGITILPVQPNGTADLFKFRKDDVPLENHGIVLGRRLTGKLGPRESGGERIPAKPWRNGAICQVEVAAGLLGIQQRPGRQAAGVLLAQRATTEALIPRTRGGGDLGLTQPLGRNGRRNTARREPPCKLGRGRSDWRIIMQLTATS